MRLTHKKGTWQSAKVDESKECFTDGRTWHPTHLVLLRLLLLVVGQLRLQRSLPLLLCPPVIPVLSNKGTRIILSRFKQEAFTAGSNEKQSQLVVTWILSQVALDRRL